MLKVSVRKLLFIIIASVCLTVGSVTVRAQSPTFTYILIQPNGSFIAARCGAPGDPAGNFLVIYDAATGTYGFGPVPDFVCGTSQ